MAEFFAMGGYAAYVWSAYGIAAVVLVGLLVMSVTGLKAKEAQLRALEERGPHRSRRALRGRATADAGPSADQTAQTAPLDADAGS